MLPNRYAVLTGFSFQPSVEEAVDLQKAYCPSSSTTYLPASSYKLLTTTNVPTQHTSCMPVLPASYRDQSVPKLNFRSVMVQQLTPQKVVGMKVPNIPNKRPYSW